LSKQSNTKELKEKNTILKFIKSKDKKKNEYISKSLLIKKYKNAKFFTNVENVSNNGLIKLRNGGYAVIFSVDAIDLSLSSNVQKNNFFNQLKYLYQLKELNLRIYKLDDKIDLNLNKDYYINLIEEYKDDSNKYEFLTERLMRLESMEAENLTTTSRYYFVIIHDNEKTLAHLSNELEMSSTNMTPRLNIKKIINKLEIYQFLVNLYLSNANIEHLM